jgi:hypothetical protein
VKSNYRLVSTGGNFGYTVLSGFGFLLFTHPVPPLIRLISSKAADMLRTPSKKLTHMARKRKA